MKLTKKLPKHILLLATLLFISLALLAFFNTIKNSKYAANVNGNYITKEKFEKRAGSVINYYEQTARKLTEKELKGLKAEVLNQLIYEEIVAQEAKKRNIVITEEQIDDFIKSTKKSLGNDEKKFKGFLKEQSYTEELYRERIKNKLTYRALSEAVTKGISDPLAKKKAFDQFLIDIKKKSSIKIYEDFE